MCATEQVCIRSGARRALGGVFLECGQKSGRELRRDPGPLLGWVRWRFLQMRQADLEQALVGKRSVAGRAFEGEAAERVYVCERCPRLAPDQLRREVVERPHHLPGL